MKPASYHQTGALNFEVAPYILRWPPTFL